jgi:hypothetical protein
MRLLEDYMTAVHGRILGLVIVMGSWACSAQEASIPLGQIERDAPLAARLTLPDNVSAHSPFSSSLPSVAVPAAISAASFARMPTVTVPRTLDSRYFMLNGMHLAMALLDVEITQRCIANHQFKEGNPMMPSSLGAQLGVDFALVGYGSYVSYKLKKQRSNLWWISPMIGVTTHSVGVGIGFNALAHQ